jgi:hypothetical protein
MDKARLHPALLGMTALGALGVAAAWFVGGPQRFGANWVLWSVLLLAVALGSLFIVALEHITRAHWSIVLRRVPERLAGLLPATALCFAVGAAVGLGAGGLGWSTPEFRAAMAAEPHLHAKAVWYSAPFFLARLTVIFAVWLVSWRLLAGGSLKQDETRDPRFSLFAKRFSAPFIWLFAITVTILGVDWLMGMSPRWFSTIFGVYTFTGVFLSGLAATVLGVLHLQKQGRLAEVRGDHLYSLGGFLFAFTVFWAYIAFSQFMLIWYANLPEETFWFHHRLTGGWYAVTLLLAVTRFLVPFFALLSREAKMDPRRLAWVAVLVLAGEALDLYWIIFPELGALAPGWQELAFALFFIGLGLLLARRRMGVGGDLPVGDPNLDASLHYHL